jgi:hypothetical protein
VSFVAVVSGSAGGSGKGRRGGARIDPLECWVGHWGGEGEMGTHLGS